MNTSFFTRLFADLTELYATSILVSVLTILCIFAWKLILDVSVQLRAYDAKDSMFYTNYANFCHSVAKLSLAKKMEATILDCKGRKEMRPIMQNVSTIFLLSSLAPFVGLLGTVQGMISTFTVLSEVDVVSSGHLTQGISEALLTTQCGLLVAIPTVLVGGMLYRKAKKVQDKLRIIALHSVEEIGESYAMA